MKKKKLAAFAAVLCGTAFLSGCGAMNPDATLVNIDSGEDKITLGYGNFIAHYTQAMYDQMYVAYMGERYWSQEIEDGKTFAETTKENILDSIEEQYLAKKHADEYDVSITDAEETKIEETAKTFLDNNSEEAIEQIGATEDYIKSMLEYETIQSRVKDEILDKADVKVTKEESEQTTISYVLFSTEGTTDEESGETTELSDDEKKELKMDAEDVAAAADCDKAAKRAGVDVETYTYTTAMDPSEDETLGEDVIKAAQALEKKGQISPVIEVEDKGYYVVRMDALKDKEATKSKEEELLDEKKEDVYDDTLEGWKKDVSWEVDEKQWAKVKFRNLFEQKTEETEEEETETDEVEETGAASEEDTAGEADSADEANATDESDTTSEADGANTADEAELTDDTSETNTAGEQDTASGANAAGEADAASEANAADEAVSSEDDTTESSESDNASQPSGKNKQNKNNKAKKNKKKTKKNS